MHKQKHPNLTFTYTETFVTLFFFFFPCVCGTSVFNMESILLLLLMWKNVYRAGIVIQTQAT